jgi:general secretion pathway protein A
MRQGEIVTLFIDEAQNLPLETLEELRMLSNLETRREKLLQIVLVGQPELDAKLDSRELRQLRQRIVTRRRIRPLNQEESREYIDHRLRTVGGSSSKVFSPEAVSLICSHAEGIPRLINVICDNALAVGYGAGQKKIGYKIILEVIRDMNGHATGPDDLIGQPVSLTRQKPENHNGHKTAVLKKLRAAVTERKKIILRALR